MHSIAPLVSRMSAVISSLLWKSQPLDPDTLLRENEKLRSQLTRQQDKALRRIKELKEQDHVNQENTVWECGKGVRREWMAAYGRLQCGFFGV